MGDGAPHREAETAGWSVLDRGLVRMITQGNPATCARQAARPPMHACARAERPRVLQPHRPHVLSVGAQRQVVHVWQASSACIYANVLLRRNPEMAPELNMIMQSGSRAGLLTMSTVTSAFVPAGVDPTRVFMRSAMMVFSGKSGRRT